MLELPTRPRPGVSVGRWTFELRWLGLAGKALVSIGLLWLLSRGLPAAEVASDVFDMRPVALAAAGLLLFAVVVLGAVRWRLVAASLGVALPIATTTRLSFEGLFFSQALPSTIGGDAVRAFRAARLGLPVRDVVHSVILDRVIGLVGLLALVAIGLPALAVRMPDFEGAGLLVLLTVAIGGAAGLLGLGMLPDRLRRLRLVAMSAALSEAAWQVLRAPFTAGSTLLVSITIHVLTVVAVALLAAGLDAPIGLVDCFLVVPASLLAAAVPISIAGWGVRESAMMGGFALLGVGDAADALALSVLFGAMLIVTSLPGGVLWLIVGTPGRASGSSILR